MSKILFSLSFFLIMGSLSGRLRSDPPPIVFPVTQPIHVLSDRYSVPDLTLHQKEQLRCVAQAVYFEARGESRKGQRAVATVIFNRSKSRRFPDNFCDIVYQKNSNGCQFTWACSDHTISNRRLYDRILIDVRGTFNLKRTDRLYDVTDGALYFSNSEPEHSKYVRIGNQFFWRNS